MVEVLVRLLMKREFTSTGELGYYVITYLLRTLILTNM
jgi:hypothetical protein